MTFGHLQDVVVKERCWLVSVLQNRSIVMRLTPVFVGVKSSEIVVHDILSQLTALRLGAESSKQDIS